MTWLERQKSNSENKQTTQNAVMNPEGRQDAKCKKDRYAHLEMTGSAWIQTAQKHQLKMELPDF